MATFYKYAERSAESQVNWAEIVKNMTDMLRDEVALREEKKAAIDEATRKYFGVSIPEKIELENAASKDKNDDIKQNLKYEEVFKEISDGVLIEIDMVNQQKLEIQDYINGVLAKNRRIIL